MKTYMKFWWVVRNVPQGLILVPALYNTFTDAPSDKVEYVLRQFPDNTKLGVGEGSQYIGKVIQE